MARRKTHKDVEFAVGTRTGATRTGRKEKIFNKFDEAVVYAFTLAADGQKSILDTIVWSEAGARWVAGEEGVKQFREDTDASVFERYVIDVDYKGRIP